MRVTNNMVSDRVVFNMQRSLRRLLDIQTQMSSGRRINKPSDDPLGTLRDLDYRTELSQIDQYRRNVSQGQNWLTTYDTVLSDIKDIIEDTKSTALTMSNDTLDTALRAQAAEDVQKMLDQLIHLSKTQLSGRQMFSGFKTKTRPFMQGANGVVYQGDSGKIKFEIEASIRQQVNLTGSEVFLKPLTVLGKDADLNIAITSATLLADFHAGTGVDLAPGTFTITDENLNITSTIDISAAVTVNDAINTINAQLAADGITNLTVALGSEGNNILLDTTQTGQLSTFTPLVNLNNGAGIEPAVGSIHVTDGAGIDVTIDMSSATTVGDAITAFNSQLAAAGVANVTMAVNPAGTGLVINDTNGVPLGLSIEDATVDDSTAAQLGIVGFVGASLNGTDLNPRVDFIVEEAGGTTATDLGIHGEHFHDSPGTDLDPVLTAASNLADLRNGLGVDTSDQIAIWQGDRSLTIDLTDTTLNTVQDILDYINNSDLDVTASINDSGRGIQIVNNDTNRSFTIEDTGNGRAAREMGLYGAGDMIGSMMVLINALKNDDREGIELLLQGFDDAITHALDMRSFVGSAAMRLETTDSRLIDLKLSFTRLLSEVEDADITQVITDLATYENNYRAAQMSAGRIIQTSLLDFLR